MCDTADISPLLSPHPNSPCHLSIYVTHLTKGGPRGPLGHSHVLLGPVNCQWAPYSITDNTAFHSYCKSVQQITVPKTLTTPAPCIDYFLKPKKQNFTHHLQWPRPVDFWATWHHHSLASHPHPWATCPCTTCPQITCPHTTCPHLHAPHPCASCWHAIFPLWGVVPLFPD